MLLMGIGLAVPSAARTPSPTTPIVVLWLVSRWEGGRGHGRRAAIDNWVARHIIATTVIAIVASSSIHDW